MKCISDIINQMQRPMRVITPPRLQVKNARQVLEQLLGRCLGQQPTWLKDYDKVVAWLTDSEYKGLLLYGKCGTGKTLIATRVLPFIIEKGTENPPFVFIAKASELNTPTKLFEANNSRVKIIDDVGTETPMNNYGIQKWTFCEVVDVAEERGQLLIVTTNLTSKNIRERYGERTFDRLRHICKPIHIDGDSLRGTLKIAF